MIPGRASAAWCLASLAITTAACVGQPRTTPGSGRGDLVVLLPDSDSGTVGRATASNKQGTVELAGARSAVLVGRTRPPALVTSLDQNELQQLIDSAFAALPPAPQHLILNFQFDSDELTPESSARLPEVLLDVKQRPVPEVLIIGHTDTIGTSVSNIALGLRRAEMIRKLLVDIGLDPSLIEIASHGEADLLIHTADEVAEPRNRRVEITVR